MYHVNSKIQTIVKRLPLMAAILGAGLAMAESSHANKSQQHFRYHSDKHFATIWFLYDGPQTPAGYADRGNYSEGTSSCNNGSSLCRVLVAEGTDGHPDSTALSALQSSINSVVSSGTGSTTVKLEP